MKRFGTVSEALQAARSSGFAAYRGLTVGEEAGLGYFAAYEALTCSIGLLPGGLGLALRRLGYPLILGSAGPGLIIGRSVTLRHPRRMHLGPGVTIDDYALLDARGAGPPGLRVDAGVLINRNAVLKCKAGPIVVGEGSIIGPNSSVVSLSGVEIGRNVLVAGNCTISAGAYPTDRTPRSMRAEGAYSKGPIRVGDDVWIGTGAMILGGITVGAHAIVAAGAVVTGAVPEGTVVGGMPARVIRERLPADEELGPLTGPVGV